MDFDENLLASLLPERNASEPLTEAYELTQILERHFQSAMHEDGANQVFYPRTEPHALRVVFGRNGQLNGIFAGPGLTNADLEAIRERARKEILETTGLAVGREVVFSSAQVEGWWKYKDVFQILPVPPSAPHAPMLLAQHPFLLEFRFQKTSDLFVDGGRRARQAWKLHLLLNALLDPGVTWGGSKVIGTSGWSWVQLPEESTAATWRVAYCQRSYHYLGFAPIGDEFSAVDANTELRSANTDEYFTSRLHGVGDPLVVSVDLELSFDRFFARVPSEQRRFLQACYWLNQINESLSFSLSLICAVQAIDCLLPPSPSGDRCPTCNLEKKQSRTSQFREFLDTYVPEGTIADTVRKDLFKVRSGLAHGFSALFVVDQDLGVGLHPLDSKQRDYSGDALTAAKVALHNWLHATRQDDSEAKQSSSREVQ